ncbi:MAG: tyrosine-type recombinase/integrase [Candidatus Hydrogenedentes bacterium]|nr:tyrosine-type recombinase/integrase [Candidatus Hydrogenedentota bacterium]
MVVPESLLMKGETLLRAEELEASGRKQATAGPEPNQAATDKQPPSDSTSGHGAENGLPLGTPLGRIVSKYIDCMKTRRTHHGFIADLSYLRGIFGPVCAELERKRTNARRGKVKLGQELREPHIEATRLEEVTTSQIADFIRESVQRYGLQSKTANRYREVLHRLFSWAMDEGGVRMPGEVNPVDKVKRYKESAPQIRFLSLEQIDQQFEVLKDHLVLRGLVAVYIYAGLRREEALWLTLEDIDLNAGKHGIIRIQAKTVNGESWESKTKVNRVVPISSALRTFLDRYERPAVASPWYFPSPKGVRWHTDNFSKTLRRINRAAGFPWSSLTFRHTFGTLLAAKGESLYKISTLMGNSPDICRRHYATLTPEALTQSVEFDERVKGSVAVEK